jgi:hypothetical protein
MGKKYMKIIYMSAAVGIILFIVLLLLIGGGGFFAWSYGYVGGQIIGGECEDNDECRSENCIEEKCRNIDLAVGKKCDDNNRCKDDGSLFCSSAGICTATATTTTIQPGALGAVCDAGKPCTSPLVCTGGECATATTIQPGTVGDECDATKSCASPLVCTVGKCATATTTTTTTTTTIQPGALNAVCDSSKPCTLPLVCTLGKCATATTNTPIARLAKITESCASVACESNLICGGTSKKCEAVNYIKFDDIDFPAFSYMGKPIEILGLKPADNYMALCNADLDCGGFNASSGFLFDKNTNPTISKGAITYKKINPSEYFELNNISYPISVAGGGVNLGSAVGSNIIDQLKNICNSNKDCDGFAINGNLGWAMKISNEKPVRADGSKFYRRK